MSLAVAAVIGFGTAVVGGQLYVQREALSDQKDAQRAATAQAQQQATRAERDFNRLNQKKPNLGAMLASNAEAASGGVGSTMLTGPQGADMSGMRLGRTSLLGA